MNPRSKCRFNGKFFLQPLPLEFNFGRMMRVWTVCAGYCWLVLVGEGGFSKFGKKGSFCGKRKRCVELREWWFCLDLAFFFGVYRRVSTWRWVCSLILVWWRRRISGCRQVEQSVDTLLR